MAIVQRFTDEQARALINLDQQYKVWMETEQTLFALPYDLRRKEVGGRIYLYEILDRNGNGKSLGPWSDENEAKFETYRRAKSEAKDRRDASLTVLKETGQVTRALRLPQLAAPAGEILREADIRSLLGSHLLVVGTNVLSAYAIEAGGIITLSDETQDFDMTWSAKSVPQQDQVVWKMLKAVDPTFTVNTERPFQARNRKAYEFELLVAPSRVKTLSRTDHPHPTPLPEQEWLLNGKFVDRVVPCRDGQSARIVAPDPRWFALQKLWLSQQAKRDPLKRGKDKRQAKVLLEVVRQFMPQYPLDAEFETNLPSELVPLFAEWKRHPGKSA
jgi:hypothetical protein